MRKPAPSDPPLDLSIAPLSMRDAPAAYALAQLQLPHLELERWESFLCDWSADADGRGILAAHNPRGGLLGIVCWWRQPDLEHGETLWAGPFMVHERGVRPLVRHSLFDAVSRLAVQANACLRIHDADNSPRLP